MTIKKKKIDGATEVLWAEREAEINVDPLPVDNFIPAIETEPTPEAEVLIRIEL